MTSNHVNETEANDEVEEEPCEEQKKWLSQPFGIEPEAAQDQRIMELRPLAEIENNRRGGGKDATETEPSNFVHVEEESRNRREQTVLRKDMNTAEQEVEKAGSGITTLRSIRTILVWDSGISATKDCPRNLSS